MRTHALQHGRPLWARLLADRAVSVGFLLLVVVAAVSMVNGAFATGQNLRDLLVAAAPAVIVGCGMTLIVLTGEIDISVGSVLGLLAALMGVLSSPSHAGLPVYVVVLVTLGAGAGVGLLNGVLVTVARVPSIVATLGMLTVVRGITEIVMKDGWITDLPPGLRLLGTGEPLGVPVCLWVAGVVVGVSVVIARRTRLGVRVYAVGGNAEAAAYARISPTLIKLFTFTFTGLLVGVAALVSVPQLSVIESGTGEGFELVVVTAVLVGGTSIRGGVGGILGTVIAALLLKSIRPSLIFLDLGDQSVYWERAIQGAFILGAVLVDHVAGAGRGMGLRRGGSE